MAQIEPKDHPITIEALRIEREVSRTEAVKYLVTELEINKREAYDTLDYMRTLNDPAFNGEGFPMPGILASIAYHVLYG